MWSNCHASIPCRHCSRICCGHADHMSETCQEGYNGHVVQARLEGRDEEDADEIALPPIPLEDVRDLALASSRSTVRECGVTHIRRGQPLIVSLVVSASKYILAVQSAGVMAVCFASNLGASSSNSGGACMPCAGGGWSSACMAKSAMASFGSCAKVI